MVKWHELRLLMADKNRNRANSANIAWLHNSYLLLLKESPYGFLSFCQQQILLPCRSSLFYVIFLSSTYLNHSINCISIDRFDTVQRSSFNLLIREKTQMMIQIKMVASTNQKIHTSTPPIGVKLKRIRKDHQCIIKITPIRIISFLLFYWIMLWKLSVQEKCMQSGW